MIETQRLCLTQLTLTDAPFILTLLTDPQWLLHIGDRGVRTLRDAEQYIEAGPLLMYQRHGFGLWRVGLRPDGEAIGLCGLLQRDYLDDIDIGFALLPQYRGQGLAGEAARATLEWARATLGKTRIAAITAPANHDSEALLLKLGFNFERLLRVPPKDEQLKLFAIEFPGGGAS